MASPSCPRVPIMEQVRAGIAQYQLPIRGSFHVYTSMRASSNETIRAAIKENFPGFKLEIQFRDFNSNHTLSILPH